MLVNLIAAVLGLLLGVPSQNVSSEIVSLEKYNIDESAVTLSGFSAGASMATQMNVAHSSDFSGLAMFSQVFYRCGPNSLVEFGLRCSKRGLGIFPYKVEKAIEDALLYEQQGLIDSLDNLKKQKIFIWTGNIDEYIPPDMAEKNKDFYERFIGNSSQVKLTIVPNTVHVFPTINYGDKCDQNASDNYYLGSCNYSGAYNSLKYLLGDRIKTKTNTELSETRKLSPLMRFNQSEFYPEGSIEEVAMGTTGFIYIPSNCQHKQTKCLLHFNFHGCNEWPPEVAEPYILNSGFLPVAEDNNIIIVFPLTTKVPTNMDGCWDFFSYTGPDFGTKKGGQVKVVHRMFQRIVHGVKTFIYSDLIV